MDIYALPNIRVFSPTLFEDAICGVREAIRAYYHIPCEGKTYPDKAVEFTCLAHLKSWLILEKCVGENNVGMLWALLVYTCFAVLCWHLDRYMKS